MRDEKLKLEDLQSSHTLDVVIFRFDVGVKHRTMTDWLDDTTCTSWSSKQRSVSRDIVVYYKSKGRDKESI